MDLIQVCIIIYNIYSKSFEDDCCEFLVFIKYEE